MNFSLKEPLDLALMSQIANKKIVPRIVIVGIGNELNGDDGAGLIVIRQLRSLLPPSDSLLLLEGSIAPENYTATIRRFQPDWIWLVDAAEMGRPCADIAILETETVVGMLPSTHSMPLSLLSHFLEKETAARVFIMGIQPQSIEPFSEITPEINNAAFQMADQLNLWIREEILSS